MNRIVCRRPLKIGEKWLGGTQVFTCIPVTSTTQADLRRDIRSAAALHPDAIEWRADFYDQADQPDALADTLRAIAPEAGGAAILFTLRAQKEGGAKFIPVPTRIEAIHACCRTGLVAMADFELRGGSADEICSVRDICREAKTRLILSSHYFENTPPEEELRRVLSAEQEAGADICKCAVMPQSFEDVLTLMRATYRARTGDIEGPMITMSMGELGKITRIIGGSFGSDLTFAAGSNASAPGQVPAQTLARLWELLQ